MRKIGIIGVPSSAGARHTGQERAPRLFRQAGLIGHLQSAGSEVVDYGDLSEVHFQPDQKNPKAQNLQLVADVVARVAEKVQGAILDNALPIVLGGDCTITLGVVAGLAGQTPNLGLMYFDGDVDLNTPDTTPSGIFDGMVMAHMIGKGHETLARSGPRYPLMAEEDIVLFGYNADAGAIDPPEIEELQQCHMMKYPVSRIQGKAGEVAREALSHLEKRTESILVHFDVDVIDYSDFPVGDVAHHGGLSFDDAMSVLGMFAASPKFGALVITEFNADRDPDGTHALRFVDAVAKTLEEKA